MDDWQNRLSIQGRPKLPAQEFAPTDLLYRGYALSDLDDTGWLSAYSFESTDLSCNWNRFSEPRDIIHSRLPPSKNGCYSLTVETARYKQLATPCHDPIEESDFENYAHVEIRWLREGEKILFEPPKGRANANSKAAKAARLAWRQNCALKAKFELAASV